MRTFAEEAEELRFQDQGDMTIFVRGASVFFSVVFLDEDGEPASPTSARLKISYRVRGSRTAAVTELTMTEGDPNTWEATWDSSPAEPGPIYWWAQSGDPPKSATEGNFVLEANAANPSP